MGFCYMMSKERAEQVAKAMKLKHPKMAAVIDADLVRMYCISDAEANEAQDGAPGTPSWFDTMPPTVIAGHIDLKRLLDTGLAEIKKK
jgi:hypothetical protein